MRDWEVNMALGLHNVASWDECMDGGASFGRDFYV